VAIVVTAKKLLRKESATKRGNEQAHSSTPRDSPWQRTRLKQS